MESKKKMRILDLGVGSGAVVLSLLAEMPSHFYAAGDCSSAAVDMARRNALRFGLLGKVTFFVADWFTCFGPLTEKTQFDIITANPPYVPSHEISRLEPEIAEYEPRSALDGGPDGLRFLRFLAQGAPAYLSAGGYLLMEMGAGQKRDLQSHIEKTEAYAEIDFWSDYAGITRVVCAKKNK